MIERKDFRAGPVILLGSGGANDGGGLGIFGGHVIHIPGNNPEGWRLVQTMMQYALSLEEGHLRAEIIAVANRVAEPLLENIYRQAGGA